MEISQENRDPMTSLSDDEEDEIFWGAVGQTEAKKSQQYKNRKTIQHLPHNRGAGRVTMGGVCTQNVDVESGVSGRVSMKGLSGVEGCRGVLTEQPVNKLVNCSQFDGSKNNVLSPLSMITTRKKRNRREGKKEVQISDVCSATVDSQSESRQSGDSEAGAAVSDSINDGVSDRVNDGVSDSEVLDDELNTAVTDCCDSEHSVCCDDDKSSAVNTPVINARGLEKTTIASNALKIHLDFDPLPASSDSLKTKHSTTNEVELELSLFADEESIIDSSLRADINGALHQVELDCVVGGCVGGAVLSGDSELNETSSSVSSGPLPENIIEGRAVQNTSQLSAPTPVFDLMPLADALIIPPLNVTPVALHNKHLSAFKTYSSRGLCEDDESDAASRDSGMADGPTDCPDPAQSPVFKNVLSPTMSITVNIPSDTQQALPRQSAEDSTSAECSTRSTSHVPVRGPVHGALGPHRRPCHDARPSKENVCARHQPELNVDGRPLWNGSTLISPKSRKGTYLHVTPSKTPQRYMTPTKTPQHSNQADMPLKSTRENCAKYKSPSVRQLGRKRPCSPAVHTVNGAIRRTPLGVNSSHNVPASRLASPASRLTSPTHKMLRTQNTDAGGENSAVESTELLTMPEPELEAVTILNTVCNGQQLAHITTKPSVTASLRHNNAPRQSSRVQWPSDVTDPALSPPSPHHRPILHTKPTDDLYPFSNKAPSPVVVRKTSPWKRHQQRP